MPEDYVIGQKGTQSEASPETHPESEGGPVADGEVNPCEDAANVPPMVPGEDCQTTDEDLPDFQSIIIEQESGTAYTTYSIESFYDEDFHTLQMPVANTSIVDASFAVVAQPTMKKRVAWSAQKFGDWPDMPAMSSSPNEIILRTIILGRNIELMADQVTVVYTVKGEYIYGFINPNVPLYMGTLPYIGVDCADTALPAENFVSGIDEP
jgi:hypothetical protein